MGQWNIYDREYAYPIPPEEFNAALGHWGVVQAVISIPFDLDEGSRQAVNGLIPAEFPENQRSELLGRMLCREYLFVIEKN